MRKAADKSLRDQQDREAAQKAGVEDDASLLKADATILILVLNHAITDGENVAIPTAGTAGKGLLTIRHKLRTLVANDMEGESGIDKLCRLAFEYFLHIGELAVEDDCMTKEEFEQTIEGWTSDSRGIEKLADAFLENVEELFQSQVKRGNK